MKKELLAILFIQIIIFSSCFIDKKLPQEAKEKILNSEEFMSPIDISVPSPDSKEDYDEILNNPVLHDYGLIPNVRFIVDNDIPLRNFKSYVISYLTRNNYLEIKTLEQTTRTRYSEDIKSYEFILYTTSGLNNLIKREENNYCFNFGIRKLKTIDYENIFPQTIDGVEVEMYGIKFSYTIDPLLVGFEEIKNQIYLGEAQLYLDPANGNWKIYHLSLNDGGNSIFFKIMENS